MKIYCSRNNQLHSPFVKLQNSDVWILCDISEERMEDDIFAAVWMHIQSVDSNNRTCKFNMLNLGDTIDDKKIKWRLYVSYDGVISDAYTILSNRYLYTIHEPSALATTEELLELAKENNGRPPYADDV